MKPSTFFVPYAKSAYEAYGAVTDHKNYQGLPMPEWEQLTETIQQAWVGAVKDVVQQFGIRDAETGEPYVNPS